MISVAANSNEVHHHLLIFYTIFVFQCVFEFNNKIYKSIEQTATHWTLFLQIFRIWFENWNGCKLFQRERISNMMPHQLLILSQWPHIICMKHMIKKCAAFSVYIHVLCWLNCVETKSTPHIALLIFPSRIYTSIFKQRYEWNLIETLQVAVTTVGWFPFATVYKIHLFSMHIMLGTATF